MRVFVPLVALLGAALAATLTHTAGAQQQAVNRMVYFAPAAPAQRTRQPFPVATWQAKGVQLVNRSTDLTAAVTPATGAILVDTEVLLQVDRAWLRAQLGQKRVIAGINLNLAQLEEVLGDPQARTLRDGCPAPASERSVSWTPNEPHFALIGKSTGPHRGCYSAGQGAFHAWSQEAFLARVQQALSCAKSYE